MLRAFLVIACALLIGVQAVRNWAVAAYAELHPGLAAGVWAGHPDVQLGQALVEIARSATARLPVPRSAFARIDDAALKAPLSPQPFLVRGVQASVAGDRRQAAADFLAAQRRDPRSIAAAYFLTDYYFRAGRPLPGLRQAALLARLSPAGAAPIGKLVAAYAQDPANWADIRALFGTDQSIEDAVLTALARDDGNASAILAIADRGHRSASSPWLTPLLKSLVRSGDYGRARAIWASVADARMPPGALLYDPGFAAPDAPPPFNWTLAASNLGIAERQDGGLLHVIYYGGNDGVLASQLLLLEPGSYRLEAEVAPGSDHAETIFWSLRCDRSSRPIAAVPLESAGLQRWTVDVPAGCPAQWLELVGKSVDIPRQAEVTLGKLALTRVGARG